MKQREGRRNSLRQQNFTTMDVPRRRSRPGEQREALDLFGSVAHRVSGNLLDNLNVARLSAPASAALQASCVAREGALEDLGATCRLFARCVAKTVARTKTQRRFRACVIGTGPAGSRIASMLLESGDVLPRELVVHSRHFPPQGLPEEVHHAKTLEDAIVECVPRIIFLVCTLGQFETLASDLRPLLRPTHVVCPLVAGLSAAKAGKMLGIAHPVRIISYRHYTPVAHLACALCDNAESKAQDSAETHGVEPRIDEISESVSSAPAHVRRTRLTRDEFALALEALREACILQATSLGLTLEKAEQACEAVISGPGMAQSARALFLVQDPRSRAKLLPMASAYF